MVSFISYLFYIILLCKITAFPEINLDLTDWINDNQSNIVIQHDCLHVAGWIEEENDPYQIISYCMSEWPSKWNIQKNNQDQKFTFAKLCKLNIISEQLYLWSTPMDVVEPSSSSMATHIFYNCTSSRFGPLCQYSLDVSNSHHLTLNEIIREFYLHEYEPTTLTCYTHLQCDRGSISSCLDWSEICDGVIDCRNGVDEEPCWQIEMNECEDHEDRCGNGQCIPKIFFHDGLNLYECLDRSDEQLLAQPLLIKIIDEPTFAMKDVTCSKRHESLNVKLASSCLLKRKNLLQRLMFSDKPNQVSNDCWLAVKCYLAIEYLVSNKRFDDLIFNQTWTEIINKTCPDMLYVPASPVAFGHMYSLYTKNGMLKFYTKVPTPQYVGYNDQICGRFNSNQTLLSFNNNTCRRSTDFPLNFKSYEQTRGNWNKQITKQNTKIIHLNSSITKQTALQHQKCCNRGLFVRVWIDYEKNLTTETCLCPPSFYGDMCQYQNQRINFTLQFQTYSDSRRTLFAIVVSLIDDSDEQTIHSYQQFSYLRKKKHYSIHIDIYEKVSLTYRRSFLIPIKFPFLPVHRVAVQLSIARTTDDVKSCSNQQCVHGQCIKYADNLKGFNGDRCEIADNKNIVSFHRDIILPNSLLVHFIQVIDDGPPTNGSTFKIISVNQNTVIINWSYPFHIAFIQFFNKDYYLISVQKKYYQSITIVREIQPSDRCRHINEVLNETIVKFHLLHRIKYYHLPCQRHSPQVSCFYDDIHFCLCNNYGQQRVANCFEFNYKKKFDCFGQSNCENGAQCLQDRSTCAQTSTCVFLTCFYGRRCQFSSNVFGLSLDAILGYHIQPHIAIRHQSLVVQLCIVLTIIMTVAGLINSALLMIAINNREPRKIGCGIYLINSSITTIFTMILFALKCSILIIAQKTYITNRLFLQLQCTSIDFLLRIGLNMDQWLSACIAIERTVAAIKGTSFDKKKSKKKMTKYIVFILLILNISTTIHDPIHRRLIDDDDDDDSQKRIWCIATYSSTLQTFNIVVNIFHFSIPFIINLISGTIIVLMTARQRRAVRIHASYRKILYKQFEQHRHLLITPIVLVILAIPHLIISLISHCIKSINHP
ncbi:unnamed protein product [Rotaria sp. Silwood2]|nr:unnamed protein product [Rotaria sp. Silwood2]